MEFKKEFEELGDLVERNLKKCKWIREQSVEKAIESLMEELKELKESKGKERVGELGDVLWDALNILMIAEIREGIKVKDSIKKLIKKIKHRKPYLFNNEEVDAEKAVEIWNERKKIEKI